MFFMYLMGKTQDRSCQHGPHHISEQQCQEDLITEADGITLISTSPLEPDLPADTSFMGPESQLREKICVFSYLGADTLVMRGPGAWPTCGHLIPRTWDPTKEENLCLLISGSRYLGDVEDLGIPPAIYSSLIQFISSVEPPCNVWDEALCALPHLCQCEINLGIEWSYHRDKWQPLHHGTTTYSVSNYKII